MFSPKEYLTDEGNCQRIIAEFLPDMSQEGLVDLRVILADAISYVASKLFDSGKEFVDKKDLTKFFQAQNSAGTAQLRIKQKLGCFNLSDEMKSDLRQYLQRVHADKVDSLKLMEDYFLTDEQVSAKNMYPVLLRYLIASIRQDIYAQLSIPALDLSPERLAEYLESIDSSWSTQSIYLEEHELTLFDYLKQNGIINPELWFTKNLLDDLPEKFKVNYEHSYYRFEDSQDVPPLFKLLLRTGVINYIEYQILFKRIILKQSLQDIASSLGMKDRQLVSNYYKKLELRLRNYMSLYQLKEADLIQSSSEEKSQFAA